ncbi:MAG: hypothetical protein EOP55_22280 [Sphingobacteriales bacterium]|nr:MAG: hypothetical protein EOP55_22280 [Sphingobacteriales bacterium]
MDNIVNEEADNENLLFRIRVEKTNFFNIKFNYQISANSKHYHFIIEKLLLTPHGDYKNLLVGTSIVKGQPPMSFGVCNIGENLSLKQPRFDVEAIIKVPFFRSGHFFNVLNSSTYKKGENSVMNIELFKGSAGNIVLLDKVELVTGRPYNFPVTF